MNITQQGMILLLKSAITGEKLFLPEDFDLEAALPEIKRHKIHTLAFQGAVNCGIPQSHPVMRQLFQSYCQALAVSESQLREIQRIYQAFDDNGIDYMPLKGCNMKSCYPKPELRLMGDADILIRMEQYEKIVPVMESLGFTFKCESDYDLCWQSSGLYVELHRRLIASWNTDWTSYFDNWWEKAQCGNGTHYFMTPENEWLYLFTHFTKHFRDSGIGCRHVVDLWVFLRTHPDLDEGYIQHVLQDLWLLEFYKNIRQLISVWFENGQPDEKTNLLEACVFASGGWGYESTRLISWAIRDEKKLFGKNARFRYLWSYLFPDLHFMQIRYKILRKLPCLLPVMWILRLGYKVIFDRQELKKKGQNLSVITEENILMRRRILNFVGLDFH